MARLAIADRHGHVDVRGGVPKGYIHVRGDRLGHLCDQQGVRRAAALVNIEMVGPTKSRHHRITDGVVIAARDMRQVRRELDRQEQMLKSKRPKIEGTIRRLFPGCPCPGTVAGYTVKLIRGAPSWCLPRGYDALAEWGLAAWIHEQMGDPNCAWTDGEAAFQSMSRR
jgi:hypothetical protein